MAALPVQCLGIQIHYTGEEYWVTTALSDGSVFLYDSLVGNTETLSLSLKEQLSTEYKCAANDSALIVTDCGLFSIAFAYHAAIGDNLRTLIFDQGRHSHLLSCFERSELAPFPLATTTTDAIRRCALRHHVIILHCTCRMPDSGKMIQCNQWYHYVCAVHLLKGHQNGGSVCCA